MVDIVDLRNLVAEAEGTTDERAAQENFASGYDIPFGYGRYLQPSKPISQMTFQELRDFQGRQVNATKGTFDNTNEGTSAVGRYQFIGPTLENLKNRLGYKDTDVFSPEVQDRLFDALMEEQGLQELSAGLITPEKFQEKLSSQFASIPKPGTETGTYKGQGTGVTSDRVSAVLSSMQADTQTDQMLSEEQSGGTFRPEDGTVPSDTGTVTGDQAEEEPGFLDTVGEYVGDAYDTASEYAGETVDTLERVAENVGQKLRRLIGSEEEQQDTEVDTPPIPERRPVMVDEPPIPEPRPKQADVDFSDVVDFVGTLKKAEGGSVEKEVEFVKEDDDDVPDPPPGATPEEVADDIPAYLSTGEYVLPANVVRYIGLKNITGMHQRALAELQQMEDLDIIENVDENGYVEEDDDEMDYMKPEEAGVVEIVVAEHHPKGLMAMGFADGGLVEAMVYVPGVGFVPQTQAAYLSGTKDKDEKLKEQEDTDKSILEGGESQGDTNDTSEGGPTGKGYGSFSDMVNDPSFQSQAKAVTGLFGTPLAVDIVTGALKGFQEQFGLNDPNEQIASDMAGATDDPGTTGAPGMGDTTGSGVGSGVEGGLGTTGGHDDGGEDSAADSGVEGGLGTTGGHDDGGEDSAAGSTASDTSEAAAEAASSAADNLRDGGYVSKKGIMAKGFAEGGDPGGGPGGPLEYEPEPEPEVIEEEKPTDPYEGYTYVKGIGYVPTSRRATSNKPIESASLALSSIFTPGFLETIGLMSDPNKEL
jgi:hypothetical protein